MKERALVIFSGGQDSTTLLYWAKKYYKEVFAITFNYGQNHSIELDLSKKICKKENIHQAIIDISFLGQLVESALTSGGNVNELNKLGLPASFVPNRNQLFITLSHAYLQKLGGGDLITGVCQTDYSGYPDCRMEFIEAIQAATNLGSGIDINIITPLMYLNKAETFKLAKDLGRLDDVLEMTNTCYNGMRDIFHEWGWGCDKCPACELRKLGYFKFKELYD